MSKEGQRLFVPQVGVWDTPSWGVAHPKFYRDILLCNYIAYGSSKVMYRKSHNY